MQLISDYILHSPSDLITFMESPYASAMERRALFDISLSQQRDPADPILASLSQKGNEHEEAYADSLRDDGHDIFEIPRSGRETMHRLTVEAMRKGHDIIAQGYLKKHNFAGLSDFLYKVPGRSKFGDYHYEAWDTKLAKKVKPYFAMQLCCYSEMLAELQGIRPKEMVVVTGDNKEHRFRVDHFFTYYRNLKNAYLEFHKSDLSDLPSAVDSRSYGLWTQRALQELEKLQHLSLVANMRQSQIKTLNQHGILTMGQLAKHDGDKPANIGKETFARFKEQARLQISSKGKSTPDYEVVDHKKFEQPRGLNLLPPASPMDIYFDIEGYPLIDGGLEYLWGASYKIGDNRTTFKDFWAHDQDQEKRAFDAFMQWVWARWQADPSMHIYHYASYEVTAVRKLMGRYGIWEDEVDTLLRNHVFVDLYKLVRHGLIVGEPRYSIKNIEHLYRAARDTDVASGGDSVLVYEAWRENPDGLDWQSSKILNGIRDYNIDDCDSTLELTDWLRERQSEKDIPYKQPNKPGEMPPRIGVQEKYELRDNLLEVADEADDENLKSFYQTIAWSLEFHRRENKPVWWRYFDRMGQTELDLYDDYECLAGLARTKTEAFKATPKARNLVYEYEFDAHQPFKGSAKSFKAIEDDTQTLTTESDFSDLESGLIGLKAKNEPQLRLNVVPSDVISPKPIPSAIEDVAKRILENGPSEDAISDFLLRRAPRMSGRAGGAIVDPSKDLVAETVEAAQSLQNSYLCIQGPPGAGKTYTASRIIGALVKDGKKVGVASNSHKAITNLLVGASKYCKSENIRAHIVKGGGDKDDPDLELNGIVYTSSIRNFAATPGSVFGGTAWAFSNEDAVDAFDFLFIDEAGQVPVSNLIGMSRSTQNIIMMGDQMQLAQPSQGVHPGDSGDSILNYLLGEEQTIDEDMGIFLPITFRMHPDVTAVISEQVYEDRLRSAPYTKRHEVQILGPRITKKAGVCYIPVEHEGREQDSPEEVTEIRKIVKELIGSELWEKDGKPRKLSLDDILFIAPYNMQVRRLQEALGSEAKVGSIDKFQGQEAPVVIISMCTSDATQSARGLEFVFSKNRLNVAVSRAEALAIVVGHPDLAHTKVNSLRQMELVNFFAEIVERGK